MKETLVAAGALALLLFVLFLTLPFDKFLIVILGMATLFFFGATFIGDETEAEKQCQEEEKTRDRC